MLNIFSFILTHNFGNYSQVVEGQNVVHIVEHTSTDVDDRPTTRVYIADSGVIPTPTPFYISDDPYE